MKKITFSPGVIQFVISVLIAFCILYGAKQYRIMTCQYLLEAQGEVVTEISCR